MEQSSQHEWKVASLEGRHPYSFIIAKWNQKIKASLEPTAATGTPDYVVRVLPRNCEDLSPNIKALLRIGYTLPVGSADIERSFSCLPRLLTTYLKGLSVSIIHTRERHLFFLQKTIELSYWLDKISFRTAPPTEICCLYSQVIF